MEEGQDIALRRPHKTVLFVCVENSGRSKMAEAIFNGLAPSNMKAISAGTKPAPRVNPYVVKALQEIGVSINSKPKLITQEMVEKADRIITMGCDARFCPRNLLPRVEDWGIEDPKGRPLEVVREIREEIRSNVKRLIEDIK